MFFSNNRRIPPPNYAVITTNGFLNSVRYHIFLIMDFLLLNDVRLDPVKVLSTGTINN